MVFSHEHTQTIRCMFFCHPHSSFRLDSNLGPSTPHDFRAYAQEPLGYDGRPCFCTYSVWKFIWALNDQKCCKFVQWLKFRFKCFGGYVEPLFLSSSVYKIYLTDDHEPPFLKQLVQTRARENRNINKIYLRNWKFSKFDPEGTCGPIWPEVVPLL